MNDGIRRLHSFIARYFQLLYIICQFSMLAIFLPTQWKEFRIVEFCSFNRQLMRWMPLTTTPPHKIGIRHFISSDPRMRIYDFKWDSLVYCSLHWVMCLTPGCGEAYGMTVETHFKGKSIYSTCQLSFHPVSLRIYGIERILQTERHCINIDNAPYSGAHIELTKHQ